MADNFLRRTTTDHITYDEALEKVRRYREQFPNVAPEVAAVGLLRQIDSWEEYRAILRALDTVIAENDES